jgi:hypothetical protein
VIIRRYNAQPHLKVLGCCWLLFGIKPEVKISVLGEPPSIAIIVAVPVDRVISRDSRKHRPSRLRNVKESHCQFSLFPSGGVAPVTSKGASLKLACRTRDDGVDSVISDVQRWVRNFSEHGEL